MIEKIYDNVPIYFQNMMISTKGFLNSKERYGKAYYKERAFLKLFDGWLREKQEQFQLLQLKKLINYASEKSVFYKKLYEDIDIKTIKKIEDLKKLPIVDKEMLRKNMEDVITIPRKGAIEGHTGGTTGKSLVVLSTKEDTMKRMAMLDHFKERVGFKNLGMKRATFNGKHIIPTNQKEKVFWRYNKPVKQMIYSSFHLTEENIGEYVKSLNEFKPEALDGFFMSLCDIANYIERHQIKIMFTLIAIFPTSETLTETGRELLERVFKCKVYDQYASSEGAPFITECTNQVPHIELASGVFEHFEDGSDEILVTSFTTYGTPLIRYRIGDSVKFKEGKCSCGLESPIVSEIKGRNLDYLLTSEGAKINGGNVANLFKNLPNTVIRAQAIQEKLDVIKVLLEVDNNLYNKEFDQLLEAEFRAKFGKNTKLVIEKVNEIPREKSGKFKLIVNKLEKNL